MTSGRGTMRQWLRKWRTHLILAPLVLTVGLGFNAYQTITGNDDNPTSPEDVPKGQAASDFLGRSFELTKVETKQPSGFSASSYPKGSVVIVATFRGRADEAQLKKTLCESTIEAPDGTEWESDFVSTPLVPADRSTSCDGAPPLKDTLPPRGEWYTFSYGYAVPKERAKQQLRPTLSYYKEFPRYLRFEP